MLGALFEAFWEFMDKGGVVLYAIFALSVMLFALFAHRFYYLIYVAPVEIEVAKPVDNFHGRRKFWIAQWHRHMKNMTLIKLFIMLLPLFGLLGTVTGMIEVFEVMAHFGNSNARLMASGVAKAIIPTMSAMALAVVGLMLFYLLQSIISKRNTMLEKALS